MLYQINHGVIVPFIQKYYKQMIGLVASLFIASMAAMTFNANAAPMPVYDSTVNPLPGNMVSLGFQATQTAEVGARIVLAPGERKLDNAVVTMSSWACESGAWNTGDCSTTPGAKFQHPITFTAYNVEADGTVGTEIGSVTQTFDILYRPSANPLCANTATWSSDGGTTCFNGFAQNIIFDLNDLEVPNEFVYGISFNTNTWGYTPINAAGPYESLNVALVNQPAGVTTGTLVDSYDATGAIPQFEAMGSWIYTPAVQLNAIEPDTTPPTGLLATYNERPGGNAVANGGATDSLMFTFNLSATGDPVRYQLKYWNDIVGSPYKIGSPWNPSDLAGYSPVLGTYNDQFTQGEGKHYFSFSACDASNNCSPFSDSFVVTYDVTDPSVPVHLSPTDGSFKTTATQTLIDWQDVTDPSSPVTYLYQSSNNPATSGPEGAFVSPAYNSGVLGSSQIATPGTPQGVWYWHVRAVDAAGNMSNWSNAWMVTIDNTAPAIPSPITMKENDGELSDLTNGGYTNSYSVTTSWGPVADVSYYEYSYWNDIPANPYKEGSRYIATPVNSTSLSGVFNQGQGVHHVAVRAVDASGNKSDWSTTFTITYDSTLPSVPTLLTPTNSSTLGTNVFSFTWNASTDVSPVKYEFQSSLSPSQSGGVLNSGVWNNIANGNADQNNLTTPTIPSVGAPDGTWYWQVRALDAAGNVSGWSVIWNVTLDTSEGSTLGVSTDVPNTEEEEEEGNVLGDSDEKDPPVTTTTQTDTTGGQGEGGQVLADTDTLAATGDPAYLNVLLGTLLTGLAIAMLLSRRKSNKYTDR